MPAGTAMTIDVVLVLELYMLVSTVEPDQP